ncbi:MAG TPA: methionine biosynthesis protein MetW, partial [Rubrivivax sp.]|nr:methionine biosynthesis protein MetW [Rubrivivax sp.]
MSDALTQDTIARLVPEGAHVLDLGCGDGALLEKLVRQRRCTGY